MGKWTFRLFYFAMFTNFITAGCWLGSEITMNGQAGWHISYLPPFSLFLASFLCCTLAYNLRILTGIVEVMNHCINENARAMTTVLDCTIQMISESNPDEFERLAVILGDNLPELLKKRDEESS